MLNHNKEISEEIIRTVDAFRMGKIVLYPSDTIWGVGCLVSNKHGVDQIYEIKQRPANKHMIILVSDMDMACKFALLTPEVKELMSTAEKPTTFILEASENVPPYLISDKGEVGIRIAKKDTFCSYVIDRLGEAITSTSPNISGETTPSLFREIKKSVINACDYVVNTEFFQDEPALPSKIIRVSNGKTQTIRE